MRAVSRLILALGLVLSPALASPAAAGQGDPPPIRAAAGPEVSVRLGPALIESAEKAYGLAEVEHQAERLKATVTADLEQMGVMAGGRVDLVLVDLKPSRPTRQEMISRPGLSFRSASLGGARIEGEMTTFDGDVIPLSFTWYASDLTDSRRQSVWGDAQWAFERFSHRLSRGQLYALR
ncbi:hypothetical protein [Phenylobacterium sp.]|jgi:hypothetical protein|uniref:hypothetical protein n=1 Tax=Phenylobacterium sp. TaxID=1871053 RepID=UPI0040356FF4